MLLWSHATGDSSTSSGGRRLGAWLHRDPSASVLFGGIGELGMGDAAFGPRVVDRLARQPRALGLEIADLSYSALLVAQDLAATVPPFRRLVLVAGMARGRPLGTLRRFRWHPTPCPASEVDRCIREAGAGMVDLDRFLVVGHHFGVLPPEVVVFELEPVILKGAELSPQASKVLRGLLAVVEREAQRALSGSLAACRASSGLGADGRFHSVPP